ncbi:cation-translocating P-type ATPase C-terminal domain-containing protein [Parafrankia sp. FMc6]
MEALALGREPAEPGLMDRPPRPRSEGVIRPVMLLRAVGLFTNRLLPLPAIVWGTDELWRAWRRRARTAGGAAHPDGTSVGRPARAGRASW